MIGDDAASSFFEVPEGGQVKVKSDAELDTDKETQYTVSSKTNFRWRKIQTLHFYADRMTMN